MPIESGIPLIRFEVEGMKRTVISMINDAQFRMDEMVIAAVNDALTPEKVQAKIVACTESAINAVISEEVSSFYRHGAGRKIVADAVLSRLMPEKGAGE